MLLAQIPTTSSYRILACSLETAACEAALDASVGEEVDFGGGKRAKIVRAIQVTSGAGERPRAFIVEPPLDRVGVFPPGSVEVNRAPKQASLTPELRKSLEAKHRALAPKAVWATRSTFTISAIEAKIDRFGDPDRVILTTLVQKGPKGEAPTRMLWIARDDMPPVEAERFPIWSLDLAATVDFDGDGQDEVLEIRTEPTGALMPTIDYEYRLMHWTRGWHALAELEDHDHSDE